MSTLEFSAFSGSTQYFLKLLCTMSYNVFKVYIGRRAISGLFTVYRRWFLLCSFFYYLAFLLLFKECDLFIPWPFTWLQIKPKNPRRKATAIVGLFSRDFVWFERQNRVEFKVEPSCDCLLRMFRPSLQMVNIMEVFLCDFEF